MQALPTGSAGTRGLASSNCGTRSMALTPSRETSSEGSRKSAITD
nr:MAG TPA_asm: hypothetical protein [Bacteriophage sp.]